MSRRPWTGLVTDASTGAALSGVAITITNANGLAVATIPASIVTTATTTTGPDGQPFNYPAVLKPGAYTVTASKGNYTSQTQTITLVQGFNRLNFTATKALLSSIGTLGGLVTDSTGTTPVAGATVTVTDASGNVVATIPTTSGSGTRAGRRPDQLLGPGAAGHGYTVTVTDGSRPATKQTKITILGGQFNRLDFTGAIGIPPLHTFPAGLNFLSTPYDYSTLGFDALFGNLNTAPAGTTAERQPLPCRGLEPGRRRLCAGPDPAGRYAAAGRRLLGLPQEPGARDPAGRDAQRGHGAGRAARRSGTRSASRTPTGVPVSSLMFDNGAGGTITFAQAVSSQYHLVSPTLYRFDGAGYQPVTATGHAPALEGLLDQGVHERDHRDPDQVARPLRRAPAPVPACRASRSARRQTLGRKRPVALRRFLSRPSPGDKDEKISCLAENTACVKVAQRVIIISLTPCASARASASGRSHVNHTGAAGGLCPSPAP